MYLNILRFITLYIYIYIPKYFKIHYVIQIGIPNKSNIRTLYFTNDLCLIPSLYPVTIILKWVSTDHKDRNLALFGTLAEIPPSNYKRKHPQTHFHIHACDAAYYCFLWKGA